MASIRARKPYTGIVFTPTHAAKLFERLEYLVFMAMQSESDPLYQSGLAEALKDDNPKDGEDGDEDVDKKKKKRKASPLVQHHTPS
eukprot:15430328-Alexandrium_andersonii.AAC.2